MSEPLRDDFTNTNQIVVDWNAISAPQNGDSSIISYSLEFDAGTQGGVWTAVIGYISPFTGLTTVVTENIKRGMNYQFRLRAQNMWGWGAYSTVTTIKAATRPLMISSISASIESLTGNLLIQWQAADD